MNCTACDLCIGRKTIVYGSGNPNADIMLIGEAPGYHEDKHGKPFIGKAGKYLSKYLQLINIPRQELYITNSVKCRPYMNRTPSEFECITCSNLLLSNEIKEVKPKLVLLLGNTALHTITRNFYLKVTHYNKWFTFNKYQYYLATYHPSAAMQNKEYRYKLATDFIRLARTYKNMIEPFHHINYEVLTEILTENEIKTMENNGFISST